MEKERQWKTGGRQKNAIDPAEVLQALVKELETDIEKGLGQQTAADRLLAEGENRLKQPLKKNMLQSFCRQLTDPLIYVLLAAAAVSLVLGEVSDAVIIIAVVLLNAAVGVLQEGKAQKALEALQQLTKPIARIIRDGKEMEVEAAQLVRGDLVCLEAGMQVPADLRLVQTRELAIEESALTGEGLPVKKDAAFLPDGDTLPLGDQKHRAFMSTIVTGGRGKGLVIATGMEAEIGRIAGILQETKQEQTPLQRRLGELGRRLSLLSVAICVSLFLVAVLQKRDVFQMLLTAISLAVAAVPEGLPAVVTLCLALSVTRMVKVNTIVRRLPSVETLGSVTVVCSDKTGTLTQNRMTVQKCFCGQRLFDAAHLDLEEACRTEKKELLTGLVLCCDAWVDGEKRIGDPTELALLELALRYGLSRQQLEADMPRFQEAAFDSERKMMSCMYRMPAGNVTYTKGAPDVVLERCTHILLQGRIQVLTDSHRRQILSAVAGQSENGLRTLALAKLGGQSKITERDMVFVGFVGMQDPVRPEAAEAVRRFREAGIRTVMITGDHVKTAYAIARQLGIADLPEQCMTGEELSKLLSAPDGGESGLKREVLLSQARVFARVSPAHKVQIVQALKKQGNIVAMTGDGVNDAPSLKAADVGIAMGKNGTDVARQAADLILTDDHFATIEKAIGEGRGVYENIKKSVLFLLSSNLGEILTMFVTVLLGVAAPLRSSHILWINLITDSLPALALGVDKNDKEALMRCPPRNPGESLFAGGGFACTLFYGCLIAGISLTAFFWVPWRYLAEAGRPFSLEQVALCLELMAIRTQAQTYAFTVLGMSQLFHAVGMRDIHASVFRTASRKNGLMLAACLIGFILQILVTEHPFLVAAFGTVCLSRGEWFLLAGLAAMPLLAHELLVFFNNENNEKST